jgi:hypothetical protein
MHIIKSNQFPLNREIIDKGETIFGVTARAWNVLVVGYHVKLLFTFGTRCFDELKVLNKVFEWAYFVR